MNGLAIKKIASIKESIKNFFAFITGKTISFKEYMDREVGEIFGPDNRHFTIENKKVETPSDLQCTENYNETGAAKRFNEKYHHLVVRWWQKKIKEILSFKSKKNHLLTCQYKKTKKQPR